MKTRTFIMGLLTVVLMAFSCEEKEGNSLEADRKALEELYTEIKALSESKACSDASLWKFTALGAKACGGPTQYIAYSVEIDTDYFLNLTQTYTEKMIAFNTRYNIVSDCAMVMPPDAVVCRNGKPEFIYSSNSPKAAF